MRCVIVLFSVDTRCACNFSDYVQTLCMSHSVVVAQSESLFTTLRLFLKNRGLMAAQRTIFTRRLPFSIPARSCPLLYFNLTISPLIAPQVDKTLIISSSSMYAREGRHWCSSLSADCMQCEATPFRSHSRSDFLRFLSLLTPPDIRQAEVLVELQSLLHSFLFRWLPFCFLKKRFKSF